MICRRSRPHLVLLERAQTVAGALELICTRAHIPQTCVRYTRLERGRSRHADRAAARRWSIVKNVSADGTEKASSQELTLQARVSQVVVRTMKDLYGRGPTHAKTYLCDEYVFCVMSGGMTRDEETMIRGGEQDAVRDYRLRFQSVIAPELIRRVEDVLGQKVVSYHSQVLFDPDRLVEIFVLDSSDDRSARDQELPPPA
jgi:uncharacterized protein YbcI